MSKGFIHTVEVRGPLSYFYPLDVGITEDIAKTIVGLHITLDGRVIGKIDSINWDTGEWMGRIVVDNSIEKQLYDAYRAMSFEIEKKCPDCRYFVGCECFDGQICDDFELSDQ